MATIDAQGDQRREQAIERLRKRSEFWMHVTAYALVNGMLIVIWLVTGRPFFWPIFPLLGWGIGLFFHGVDAFRRPWSEERIRREMDRLT